MKIKPLLDKVVLEQAESEEKTASGILYIKTEIMCINLIYMHIKFEICIYNE